MADERSGCRVARATSSIAETTGRLYQRLARRLFDDLASGKYAVGDRLPAERELALEHSISRPAVREALIALEVQGYIEVRVGSGAFVRKRPGSDDRQGFAVSAFELTEARLVFEGEAAALATVHIEDDELASLDALILAMAAENEQAEVTENADRAFHLAIARATRNAAIVLTIEQFWQLRSTSPECALLHTRARDAKVRPVVEEHRAIVRALRARDPNAARSAMRAHLSAVMDHILSATEIQAIEEARRAMAKTRARFVATSSV